jgi:hypothetical protein
MIAAYARRWMAASLLVAGLAGGSAGCSDGTGPSSIAGTYHASKVTLVTGGQTVNLLTAGLTLEMELTDAATTAGTLVVPAAYTDSGTEETIDLAGTYSYDAKAKTVTFAQAGDTFVKDITWAVDGTRLTGAFDAGADGRIDVTLSR